MKQNIQSKVGKSEDIFFLQFLLEGIILLFYTEELQVEAGSIAVLVHQETEIE